MASVKKGGLRAMEKLGKRYRTPSPSPISGNDPFHDTRLQQVEGGSKVEEVHVDTVEDVPNTIMKDLPEVSVWLPETKPQEITPISVQLPMEVVELIIDNLHGGATFVSCSLVCKAWLARCRYYIFSRIYVASGSCGDLLPILRPMPRGPIQSPMSALSHVNVPLSPAGNFVQSLVVTQTAPNILSSSPVYSENAQSLLDIIPNVRELYLKGTADWEVVHFLEPLAQAQKLEGLTLSHVRVESLAFIFARILSGAPKLRSLRVQGLSFYANQNEVVLNLDANSDSPRYDMNESNTNLSMPPPFENMERLWLEQSGDSSSTDDLLGRILASSSTALTRLVELELPRPKSSLSSAIFKRAGTTLTSLTLDFRSFRITREGFIFSLSSLRVLKCLRLVSPIDPNNLLPTALVGALREYSHNTIQELYIEFSDTWFTLENIAAWREVDTLLASPHLGHIRRLVLYRIYSRRVETEIFPLASTQGILVVSPSRSMYW